MALTIPRIIFPFFSRNKEGEYFYDIQEYGKWKELGGSRIEIAMNHPILTPAILFISKLFSQANLYLENKETGKKRYNSPLLTLLERPNYYQSKQDFLEGLLFCMIAEGKAVVWTRRTLGFDNVDALYLLNPNLIKYPREFKTLHSIKVEGNPVQNKKIIYDENGENIEIPIKDLLFFYDLPNGFKKNMLEADSRIDGLRQTLLNTNDSLIAKNIILRTNGKEMITGEKDGFPFSEEEKEDAERRLFSNYGLSFNRKRGFITKAKLNWKSLHIALRDLGLDESIKVDGNIIYTALHIPKDILSLEAKKTTYNNFKESMVSYIQNEIYPTLVGVCSVLNRLNDKTNWTLRGNYDSMPIMKFILIEKYEGLLLRGQALQQLRAAGLPDEIALEECNFDKTIQLNELMQIQINNERRENQNSSNEEERDTED